MSLLFAFGLPGLLVIGGFLIWMCIHVVRTGQQIYWIFIILMALPPLGALIYFFVAVFPELIRGPTARKVGRAARETLDPMRNYRDAKAAHDETPTVHNQMRLAGAAAELGRHDEAEALYAQAAQGVHADDPALLLGRAAPGRRSRRALPGRGDAAGAGREGRSASTGTGRRSVNLLFAFGLPGLLLIGAFLIWMCVHAVRSGQQLFWIWIILVVFPPVGALVYFVAIVLPELLRGPTARKVGRAARDTLDPMRSYRDAKAAHDLAPTVHNQMRLAAAAAGLGRHDEAEALYAEAAQGVHAEDPALMLGRAKALVELDRPAEALSLLQQLSAQGKEGETPQAVLTFARAYEGLGRDDEAARSYEWAAPRLPGLEGIARQAAFLARVGKKAEAAEVLAEIDRRLSRANPHFQREGRVWRDFAAEAIARA